MKRTMSHAHMGSMMKRLTVMLLMVMVFVWVRPGFVLAASEQESNNTRATATSISVNTAVDGSVSSGSDEDWFVFTLSQAGRVNISFTHKDLTSSSNYWRIYVHDSNGNDITGSSSSSVFSVAGNGTSYSLPELGLAAGTYYVKVTDGSSYHDSSTYTLKVNFTATSATEKEGNGSRATASSMSLNTAYRGSIFSNYDDDWYKFTLTQDGRVNLQFAHSDLTSSSNYWRIYVYDSNGNDITGSSSSSVFTVAGNGTSYNLPELGLAAGTYYIMVDSGSSYRDSSTYTIKAVFTATTAAEKEGNGSRTTASSMSLNTAYRGSIFSNYDDDWYKFTLTQDGRVNLQFTHPDLTSSSNYWRIYVYDSNGNDITGSSSSSVFTVPGDGTSYDLPELGLAAGTYYIMIDSGSSYRDSSTYTIKVNFSATANAEKEANGSRASASSVILNTAYRGSIFSNYDEDWYKFVLKKADTITVTFTHTNLTSSSTYWRLYLYNSEGTSLGIGGSTAYSVTGNGTSVTVSAGGLSAGTYYLMVDSGSSYRSPSVYTIKVNSPANSTAGWKQDSNGWWYKREDGSYPKTQWEKIDGKWYHFDADGYMQTGWLKLSGKWYYLGGNGVMVTGWQQISSKWYYFDSSGIMQTGWVKSGTKWYYMNSSGVMQTGWKEISGKTYYFKSSGVMAAGEYCNGWWLNSDGTWTYKYKATWRQNARGWWFGDESGWYAKNTSLKIDDKWYSFDASGYMK